MDPINYLRAELAQLQAEAQAIFPTVDRVWLLVEPTETPAGVTVFADRGSRVICFARGDGRTFDAARTALLAELRKRAAKLWTNDKIDATLGIGRAA